MKEEDKEDGMMTEEEKKKQLSPGVGWNRIQVGENITNGESTSKTIVTGDTTGWDNPAAYDFNAPERGTYKYNPDEGILSVFKPKEPEWDSIREDRLNRIARVNAFGDFVKHLGSFSGGGHAPTEKRQENKGVLRAFAELDKMRDVHEARQDKYNDQLFGLQTQDYMDQRSRDDREYERKYAEEKGRADRKWQVGDNIRQNKQKAYWDGHTYRKNTQHSDVDQFQNLDLLMAEMAAKKKSGSGKGPFMEVQFENSKNKVTADKSQTIQSIAKLKDIYTDILNKDPNALTGDEKRISEDIGMLTKSMENGGSDNTFREIFARYLEKNWDKLKYIWGEGNPASVGGGNTSSPGGGASGGASGGNSNGEDPDEEYEI